MKIILASVSNLIPEIIPRVTATPINQIKVGWVMTATKGATDPQFVEKQREKMKEIGWQFEEIDIEGRSQDELRKVFSTKDAILVEGGNTFYLLKAIKETGFDEVIKELIDKNILYIGVSAGSYVMCPTIEMTTWKSDSRNRFGLTDLTALNYVPFLLSAHYDPKNDDKLILGIKSTKYPVKILTDKQALLILDDKVELIGEGEEIILS